MASYRVVNVMDLPREHQEEACRLLSWEHVPIPKEERAVYGFTPGVHLLALVKLPLAAFGFKPPRVVAAMATNGRQKVFN